MTEGLKSCPFCGGDAHIDGTSWRPTDGKEVAWVTCKRCGAYGPTLSVKEAIAAWNRRAPTDEAAEIASWLQHMREGYLRSMAMRAGVKKIAEDQIKRKGE